MKKTKRQRDVPEIRFPGFTDSWEQRKVRDIADRFDNLRVPVVANLRISGTTPYYGANGIQDYVEGFTHEGEFVLVAEDGANDLKNYPVRCVNGRIWVNNHAHVLQGKQNFADNQFLAFSINRADIESLLVGGGRAKLNAETMMDIFLMIPSIDEQRLIGQCVSTIDHLITLQERKCKVLRKLKKCMLQKMFPKNGSDIPEIRFPGFTDFWEQRKLGELTIYRNGTGHEEKQSESGKYELINLNSISIDGGLKPSGKFIDEETETLLKDDLVMVLSDVGHGDLLGRVAIIPENNRFVLNQRVALLRNNSSVDIKYLFSYINAHQIYFKKQGAGSSQLNISRGSVENFEVLLPHKDEQKKIGKYLSSIDNLITLQERKCKVLRKLKKCMLQKMFV